MDEQLVFDLSACMPNVDIFTIARIRLDLNGTTFNAVNIGICVAFFMWPFFLLDTNQNWHKKSSISSQLRLIIFELCVHLFSEIAWSVWQIHLIMKFLDAAPLQRLIYHFSPDLSFNISTILNMDNQVFTQFWLCLYNCMHSKYPQTH